MMRYLLLLMIAFFGACTFQKAYIKNAEIEMNLFKKNMKKKYNLNVVGEGGGFMGEIREIAITFQTCQKLSLNDLRFIIVGMYLEFLDQLNRNEKIKPYVKGNVFVPRNLDLSIMCMKANGEFQELAGVMFKNNKFFYETENPKTQLLENYYVETWEEALAIYMKALKENKSCCIN